MVVPYKTTNDIKGKTITNNLKLGRKIRGTKTVRKIMQSTNNGHFSIFMQSM